MTDKNLEKKIWRAIPADAYELPYADRMMILANNFSFDGGRSAYSMSPPKTDFEKEIYNQFQGLINTYDITRPEYVVPLIKEVVIDNKRKEAAMIFRYQMDFAIGKGFQMKEMVLYGRENEKLKEIYEDHTWTQPTSFDSYFAHEASAKLNLDPMLYLLKGNFFMEDVDLHNLDINNRTISFLTEQGKKNQISLKQMEEGK